MIHDVELNGLTFDASFDSGNAARIEALSEDEFALWTAAGVAKLGPILGFLSSRTGLDTTRMG